MSDWLKKEDRSCPWMTYSAGSQEKNSITMQKNYVSFPFQQKGHYSIYSTIESKLYHSELLKQFDGEI